MTWPRPRRWWFAAVLGLLFVDPESLSGRSKQALYIPASSLSDPRIETIRQSDRIWEARRGPRREVINQVCLVPDLPTFFQAIAAWDDEHYFPILFEDVETTSRFLRAFKPARIVRLPTVASSIPRSEVWERAVSAVGGSWLNEANDAAYRPPGDKVPRIFGPTPPGFVFSSPDAPMLAGAVALAAGRFQPLLRLDYPKKFAETLTPGELEEFAGLFAAKIKERTTIFDRMGDDCDFLTIAGDWPYACVAANQEKLSVDDSIGRREPAAQRWAYTGRIVGDAKQSVYRAMCSLFLQPDSALLFNGYEVQMHPWTYYGMKNATTRLESILPAKVVEGETSATVEGWHRAFDPINRSGLVLINSSGTPSSFLIRGGQGSTSDVPFSVPTAVLMIHSFSAYDPTDPSTIAGRWLSNGAFVYFGSMNEPYLQSFRTPNLITDLIAEHYPFVVAARATLMEPFGNPWRLVFLGDPLYRLIPKEEAEIPRLARAVPSATWHSLVEPPGPPAGSDADRLRWAAETSLVLLQDRPSEPTKSNALTEVVLAINRSLLPANLKPVHDALLTDLLLHANRTDLLQSRLETIPSAERTPEIKRTLGTLLASQLSSEIASNNFEGARDTWLALMKSDLAPDLKPLASGRVGQLANTTERREQWIRLLRTTLHDRPRLPETESIADELKRVEQESRPKH